MKPLIRKMKPMNDFLRLLTALAVTMCLCACGGSSDDTDTGSNDSDPSGDSQSGQADPPDAPSTPSSDLTGKMLDELEGVTKVLKDVKDEASAKAAAQYITEYAERNKTLAEQFKVLTPAEQVASAQKNAHRNMSIQMALQQEMMRISRDPKLSAHLSDAFDQINRQ